MRSKTSKFKQNLDKLERQKYKTFRRIDNLKRNIIKLGELMAFTKEELLKQEEIANGQYTTRTISG